MGNGQLMPNSNDSTANSTAEQLRALLDPLAKPQLVDLLARAYFSSPNSLSKLSELFYNSLSLSFSLHH